MSDIKNEIVEIIQSIDDTTLLFYQQKNEEAYKKLDELLALLMQGVSDIITLKAVREDITVDENRLNRLLLEAMKKLECKDTILLSDLLCYDVKELLMNIRDKL